MPHGSNVPNSSNSPNATPPATPPANGGWTVNKQIDLLKVLALFVAAIGAYFTLKSETETLRESLIRAETRINKLELHDEDAGAEMARLAVLEAQQRMSEKSLGEIKQTLKTIDKKVDDMRNEIRAN
jgi:hypothetical protein